jgi:chromosome segregation ATPase
MITREGVEKAISSLEAEKKTVTTRSVRALLGGGSLKKISDLIKACRDGTIFDNPSLSLLNDDIQEYSSKNNQIVESLLQKTITKVQGRETRLQEELDDAHNEIGVLEEKVAELESSNESQGKANLRLQTQVSVLQENLRSGNEEKEKLREQFQAKQEQLMEQFHVKQEQMRDQFTVKLEELTRNEAFYRSKCELLDKQASDEEKFGAVEEAKIKLKPKK